MTELSSLHVLLFLSGLYVGVGVSVGIIYYVSESPLPFDDDPWWQEAIEAVMLAVGWVWWLCLLVSWILRDWVRRRSQ